MTRGAGRWSWIEKSGSALKAPTSIRRNSKEILISVEVRLMTRGAGRWSWIEKSGSGWSEVNFAPDIEERSIKWIVERLERKVAR